MTRRRSRPGWRATTRRFWPVAVVVALAVGAATYAVTTSGGGRSGPAAWAAAPQAPLDEASAAALGDLVAGHVASSAIDAPADAAPARLQAELGPTYAALRAGGVRVADGWGIGTTTWASVSSAVTAALEDGEDHRLADAVDSVELCLTHSFVEVAPGSDESRLFTNVHRGVLGLEATFGDATERVSPTTMLATNRSFERTLRLFMEAVGATEDDLRSGAVGLRAFGCDQVLVLLEDPVRAVPMERGSTLVALEEVTEDRVERFADDLTDWLVAGLHPDGRMTYKYWPSRGEESSANNMIRQWMATNALLDEATARAERHPDLLDRVESNIRYNLEHFYEVEDELGLIVYDEKVKLGAVALAAMALLAFPDDVFEEERAALDRTVHHLWNEDGSFRTFHRPPDRDDNQNFYPGEALLYWARVYDREPDAQLLDRFMTSFAYYRAWHLEEGNRNPAFVPWHTQAYYGVWRHTRDPELADFIFEMNDWLLDVQEWDGSAYADVQGRFYASDRPFGPPHSSSTGVYLEGLADAYRLAVDVGDEDRAAAYRLAIRRGLRSTVQLQFEDEIDTFYISQRDRVLGGVRTTVYDNEIRVDNVQHTLIGVRNILDAAVLADVAPDR